MFNSAVKKRSRLSRTEQKVERTRQILEAAWAMYCEKGYEGVTIEGIAEHAGISRMPIYSLFGDKQNLYFELTRMFVGDLTKAMLGPLKAGAPLRKNLDQLAKIATSRPEPVDAPSAGLFYVVQVIGISRPDIAEKQKEVASQVIKDFADMIRASSLEPGERLRTTPEVIATLITAQINGLAASEFQSGRREVKAADLSAAFHAMALKTSAK